MTQTSYRWRNDDRDVYNATWKDSVNTPLILTDNNSSIRLRIEFKTDDTLSGKISLGYKKDHNDNPWIMINRSDTGKFILSPSKYITDKKAYSDNHLLPFYDESYYYSYQQTITIDSSESYYMDLEIGKLLYEFEYSIKPVSNIKPGSVYFFSILKDGNSIWDDEEAILKTPPVSWFTQSFGTKYNSNEYFISDISFTDANTGTAVGTYYHDAQNSGLILRTTDGGTTWTEQKCPDGGSVWLNAVRFTSRDVGTAVGSEGTILRTTNGGKDWVRRMSGLDYYFNSVSFINADTGIVIGSNEKGTLILRTLNGGINWEQSLIPSVRLHSVCLTDAKNGYMVGEAGTVMKTTDGGQIWNTLSKVSTRDLSCFTFTDVNNGYISIDYAILKTTDGGNTWLVSTYFDYISTLYFINKNTGWAAGGWGKIIKTTDGGLNWIELPSCTLHELYSFKFVDENTGWALSSGKKIFKTTNGGIPACAEAEKEKNIPERFYLSQNYPNPFNPETKIKYSVPHRTFIVIDVYDVLGKEITRLVNEEKAAGTYEVNWDAGNLSTGVYFYQLRAGNHVETKKMMLMR